MTTTPYTHNTPSTETAERMQIIEGEFSPAQANDFIASLFQGNENFYKLQRWSQSECGQTKGESICDSKVVELKAKKDSIKSVIAEAKRNGYKISIGGQLELKLVK